MNEELNPNIPDVDLRKKQQGKMLLIIAIAMVLLIGAIVLINMSLGEKETDGANTLDAMTPLEAKEQNRQQKGKYGNLASQERVGASDEHADGIYELTGEQPRQRKRSNEVLSDEDYEQVQQTAGVRQISGVNRAPMPSKAEMNRQTQEQLRKYNRRISYDIDPNTPLYQKSQEEIEQERLDREEREFQRKSTERILGSLEKSMQQPGPQQGASAPEIGASQPRTERIARPQNQASSALVQTTNDNTIGRSTTTGFYSASTAAQDEWATVYSAVPAVIHGNGDGIVVQDGSSVRLRLLAETYLNVNGMKQVLHKNTLINGICRISGERVQIQVAAIRIANNLIPVQMVAFDIDGVQGLYIPNLTSKSMLARGLTENASRSFTGSIMTQGNVGQQVGTQLAMEGARGVLNTATNFARRRMQVVRVTIKPNYKVLLKTGNLENTDYTDDISNY